MLLTLHQHRVFQEWQWQLGVLGVLIAWLRVSATLNKKYTIFLPYNMKFRSFYAKVILHVIIIIFAFAITFRLLLHDTSAAFIHWYLSAIKTLVWMRGDLAFDDTFVGNDGSHNLMYPLQANLTFVFFIIFIVGYLFNLIIKSQTDDFQNIKNDYDFFKAKADLDVYFLMDDAIPYFRKRYATDIISCEENLDIWHKAFDICGNRKDSDCEEYSTHSKRSHVTGFTDLAAELTARMDKQRDEILEFLKTNANL